MNSYLPRLAETYFNACSKVMRVVNVCGPRQCGKTTMLRHMLTPQDVMISLDDADTLDAVQADPHAFLRGYLKKANRLAIDEAQKAPELFGQIKYIVDRHPEPGRILLSGSSNYRALPTVNESMAGRLGQVRLRTLTAAEIAGTDKSHFFDDVVAGNLGKLIYDTEECNKDIVLCKALAGGYPEIYAADSLTKKLWFRDYLTALIERDLLQVADFRKKSVLSRMLQRLATSSSRTINMSEMSRDLQEDSRMIGKCLEALKTMYLVDEVPAWTRKPYDRLAKASKWEITDTGLMCALLGHYSLDDLKAWAARDSKAGSDFIGNLVETWVYNQLVPIAEASLDWTVYHLRVAQRLEIDFVIENPQGRMILIEVKAGESVSSRDFKSLRWFKENNAEFVVGSIILYCGQSLRDYGDGCYAVPMAVLWS